MHIKIPLLIPLLLQCCLSWKTQHQSDDVQLLQTIQLSKPLVDFGPHSSPLEDKYLQEPPVELRRLEDNQDSDVVHMNTIGTLQHIFNTVLTVCVHIITLLDSSSPMAMLSLILMNMTQSLKFISVDYSNRLQIVYSHRHNIFANPIIPQMPRSLMEKFSSDVSPDLLRKYGVNSPLFFVNFWQGIITLTTLFLIVAIVCVLEKCTRKSRGRFHKILLRSKHALKWNYFVSLLLCWSGEIILFSSLEFKTVKFNSAVSIISFILCILMNLAIFSLTLYMIRILSAVNMRHHQSTSVSKYKDWRVIFARFRQDSSYRQSFLLLSTIRIYIFFFLLDYLSDEPLAQTVLFTIMSLFMILSTIIARPQKKTAEFVEYLVQESAVLPLNSLSVSLAILDISGVEAQNIREPINTAIIWMNTVYIVFGSLYTIIKAIVLLFNKIKTISRKSRKVQAIALTPDTSIVMREANMKQPVDPKDISAMLPMVHNLDETINISKIQDKIATSRSLGPKERPRRTSRVNTGVIRYQEETTANQIRHQIIIPTVDNSVPIQIIDNNTHFIIDQCREQGSFFEAIKELFHHH